MKLPRSPRARRAAPPAEKLERRGKPGWSRVREPRCHVEVRPAGDADQPGPCAGPAQVHGGAVREARRRLRALRRGGRVGRRRRPGGERGRLRRRVLQPGGVRGHRKGAVVPGGEEAARRRDRLRPLAPRVHQSGLRGEPPRGRRHGRGRHLPRVRAPLEAVPERHRPGRRLGHRQDRLRGAPRLSSRVAPPQTSSARAYSRRP